MTLYMMQRDKQCFLRIMITNYHYYYYELSLVICMHVYTGKLNYPAIGYFTYDITGVEKCYPR